MAVAREFLDAMWAALAGRGSRAEVEFVGRGYVPSAFPVTEFAAAAVGVAGVAVQELVALGGLSARGLRVDQTLAAAWFAASIRPIGWEPAPVWDPLSANYEANDGWVRLHTNAPLHRRAALRALGCEEQSERSAVADAIRPLAAAEVESVVIEAGGCAASLNSRDAWNRHAQGRAVAAEPLVGTERGGAVDSGLSSGQLDPARPLRGVRVLDLTRVLAGPIATRFLAGYGANVLRIDPPAWDESIASETTLGKRCARLDAKTPGGLAQLRMLVADADIIVHGYRPGALESLGIGEAQLAATNPRLIDVSLDAYGWNGPWSQRRGFDSLVQMSVGIADAGRIWAQTDRPTPLPFQALDQATGYLMAASAIRGLTERITLGTALRARCSLARTAHLLITQAAGDKDGTELDLAAAPTAEAIEQTSWGPARRVLPPLVIEGAPMSWDRPALALGSHHATWA